MITLTEKVYQSPALQLFVIVQHNETGLDWVCTEVPLFNNQV